MTCEPNGPDGGVVAWQDLWEALAKAVAVQVQAGRSHLLTEDALRFALIMGLEERGISPAQLRVEVPEPLVDGKLDLVIDDPPRAVFELKFPRDSRTGISPDTMTLGELLKDFYRLGRLAVRERWAVQLINDRLRRYLERRSDVIWTFTPGEVMHLPENLPSRLPQTAVSSLPSWAATLRVKAICAAAHRADGHTLAVYRMDDI